MPVHRHRHFLTQEHDVLNFRVAILLYCGDSIEEISETWTRFSSLSKWAGGLGCSWTAVRGCGAHIHGTNGESSGVIPFLKVANDICVAVNQGGKRPGALM